MSVSKKLRFEIFERDDFTCQYCGRNPLDHNVVLEIDHAISKKDDGEDDEENLVTSCFDCNRGKSKKSVILKKKIDVKQELKNSKEQLEQVKKMSEVARIKKQIESSRLTWIDDLIGNYGENLRSMVKKAVKKEISYGVPVSLLQECIEITENQFSDKKFYIVDFVKYFYGVLRNKKNG